MVHKWGIINSLLITCQRKKSHPEQLFEDSFDEYDFMPEEVLTEEEIKRMQSKHP